MGNRKFNHHILNPVLSDGFLFTAQFPLCPAALVVMNSINRRIKRNRIDPEFAKLMKKLAKDKMQRAKSSVDYANGKYIQEMELDALEAEARALL